MAPVGILFVFLELATAILGFSSDPSNRIIEWIQVSQSQALLMKPDPVGVETDSGKTFDTYLCRTSHNGNSNVGKLVVFEGDIFCSFGAGGNEYQQLNFDVSFFQYCNYNAAMDFY